MKKLIICFLFVSSIVFSQNNLDYFINSALQNSPVIKEYENSKAISGLEKKLVNAENVLPQMSLTANYQIFPYFNNGGKYITTNPGPDAVGYDIGITNGGFYSAQFNIEKNLFNGGIVGALEEQQDISVKSQNNNIKVEEHNIRKQITDQYLAALQSQLNYNFAQEILKNIVDQLKVTSGLVEKGFAKQSDYLLLKVEEGNQKIECNNIFLELKNNLSSLYSMCGITDTQIVNLDQVDLTPIPAKNGSNFYSKYEIDSLSVLSQQKIFESKYQPQVKVFFNTGLNAVELQGIQRKFGLSAGIDFSLPIYDGNQKDITRQQNIISQKTIGSYKEYFASELKSRRVNADQQLKSIKQNLAQIKQQLDNYKTILRMKWNELENGQISMIEYLTVLRNYIDQKQNQIASEINYQTQINNYNYWNW